MATITITTQLAGVNANWTSVVLSDRTGTFGIKRNDTGATVVAAATALTNSAAGTYTYEFDEPDDGVEYTIWAKGIYGGNTYYGETIYTARVTAPEAVLTLSDHDEVLLDNLGVHLANFGEPVTVHPPAGASRSVTGIVTRKAMIIDGQPRGPATPTEVGLPNSATTGISGAEWNKRFTVSMARFRGGPAVTMRTTKPISQDAALITWEVA